jgi:hypothetical protein
VATAAVLVAAFAFVLLRPEGSQGRRPPEAAAAPPVVDATTAAAASLTIAVTDPQGALDDAGGRLWWVTPGCTLSVMDVAARTRREPRRPYCRAWPSPEGRVVAGSVGDVPAARRFHTLALLDGESLITLASAPIGAGEVVGPLAWSPDGVRVGLCLRNASGDAVAILSLDPVSTRNDRRRCTPAWLPDGRLVQSAGTVLAVGNARAIELRDVIAGDAQVEQGSRPAITAIGVGAGRLVVGDAIVGGAGGYAVGDAHLMAVTPRGLVIARRLLPHGAIATAVGISPDGALGWWVDGPSGVARLVAFDGDVPPGLPRQAWGYAWSPDGRHVAASLADGIVVLRLRDGARARIPGTSVRSLAWTR